MKNLIFLPLLFLFSLSYAQSGIKDPDIIIIGDKNYEVRITKEDENQVSFYTIENGEKKERTINKTKHITIKYTAKTPDNFSIENGEIIWQKVYETGLSFDEVSKHLINSGNLVDFNKGDNQFTGYINNISPKFREAGYAWANTPIPYQQNINGYAVLEFKDGRYRVSVKKIF
jgi:hypothetical protein